MRVLTICHLKPLQSTALKLKRFDFWPLSSALRKKAFCLRLVLLTTFCKHENNSFWKNYFSRNWKSIQKLGILLFLGLYLRSRDCNGQRKLKRWFVGVPPFHGWVIFQRNPCKFWNFQTVVKSFKHYMAQFFYYEQKKIWAP